MTQNNAEQKKLLKRAIAGDAQAFASLLEGHYDMIYQTAFRWLGNQPDAEDVAQNVCIKLGQSIRNFKMESQFSTWLYRIVINTANDYLRQDRRGHQTAVSDDHLIEQSEVSDQLEVMQLWKQVSQLPQKQADAVLLVYAEGFSHAEAAEVMDCKESTVSWYIHEAKKQLKALMT